MNENVANTIENVANTIAGIINEYGGRVNDEATRFTLASRIRAIAFEPVVCDENNNPPLVVEAAGLVVDVGPVRFHYTPGNIHVTGLVPPQPSPTIDIVAVPCDTEPNDD